MKVEKIHYIIQIVGEAFKIACGPYLDGTDKERGTAFVGAVTCKNCKRTHTYRGEARWNRRDRCMHRHAQIQTTARHGRIRG